MATFEEDKVRLMDMADAILEIKAFTGSLNLGAVPDNENARQTINSQLAQIGTAAALLSEDFKEEYGHIDWDALINLQFVAHDENLELDDHSEWGMIKYDLTELGHEILDLSDAVQGDEDLRRASLNPEDLRDLSERQEQEKSRVRDTRKDLEDEAGRFDEEDRASSQEDNSRINERYRKNPPGEGQSEEPGPD